MAKLAFTKLGLSKNQEIKTVEYNGQDIEVKQYLPINDKFNLITEVINNSMDGNNFINPLRIKVFFDLAVIDYYTNISFTDKQKEDPAKLYDLFVGVDLLNTIIKDIPEYSELYDYVQNTIAEIYKYRSSIMGILEAVSNDYSDMSLDATALKNELSDPNNLALLKDIVTKLG